MKKIIIIILTILLLFNINIYATQNNYITYSEMIEIMSNELSFNDEIKIINITNEYYSREQRKHEQYNNILKLNTNGFYKPYNSNYSFDSTLTRKEFYKYLISFLNYHYKYPIYDNNILSKFIANNDKITRNEVVLMIDSAVNFIKNKEGDLFNELDEDKNVNFKLIQNSPKTIDEFVEVFKYITFGDRTNKYYNITYKENVDFNFSEVIDEAFKHFYYKYPNYTYYIGEYKYRYTDKKHYKIKTISKNITSEKKYNKEKEYYNKLRNIMKSTNLTNTKEIFDWIVNNVEYDKNRNMNSFNGYGALFNGKAVCRGYTILFNDMLRMINIDNKIITGSQTSKDIYNHSWNEVYINDDTYYIDVSNADLLKSMQKYFYTNNIEDFKVFHKWDKEFNK
jgi:hypothetical protein